MNNKGFALSGIIYGILIIFLLLIFSIFSVLMNRGNTLAKIKENALNTVKDISQDNIVMSEIIADFTKINVCSDAGSHGTVDLNSNVYSPYGYEIRNTKSNGVITYSAYDGDTLVTSLERQIDEAAPLKTSEFLYSNKIEKILLNPGVYRLEAWSSKRTGGNYVSGYITLSEKKIVYIIAGGNGRNGYNGGASHIAYKYGLTADLTDEDILILSGAETASNKLTEVTTSANQSDNHGKVKITSLIYFTK